MAHCQMRFAVIASALVLLLGAAACTACASPTAAEANPQALAAFTTAYEQGQQIADSSRAAAERAMQMLPSPLGVSRLAAAVMALDSYPFGPVDVVRIRRAADVMRQFLGGPRFNVAEMTANPAR
jgi:ABC-type nitrate/sulfonate/bicarbonate transport system substrate-binding protein